jgi:pimeloyl-ACP methyl ester carboxylesterase
MSVHNVLLVPGSGHGGWWFDPIAEDLRAQGHNVIPITLTGLDHENPAHVPINLETHIQDVLRVIEELALDEVFLVAHSYGGMVVTGVADRTKAKVTGLFYMDAMVPKPGQNLWSLIDEDLRTGFLTSVSDGLNMYPDEAFKAMRPRVMPHPLGTMLQPLHYSDSVFKVQNKTYVFAEKFFGVPGMQSPFEAFYEQFKDDAGWVAHSVPYGHDLVEEAPGVVLELLVDALNR